MRRALFGYCHHHFSILRTNPSLPLSPLQYNKIPTSTASRSFAALRKIRRTPIPMKRDMSECRIAILGPHDAPHMAELKHLPPEAKIIVKGQTLEDFEGKEEELASIDVLLLAPPAGKALVSTLWPKLTNVKWIHCIFAGVDHVLFPELINSHIPLTNARGLFSSSLAEYSIMAMLYFAKDIARLTRQKGETKWEKFNVLELKGATLGIIGYGDIGQACAKLAKAFGMKVIAVRRRGPGDGGAAGADEIMGPSQIGDLMAISDYVLLAAALTRETRGIVSAPEFKRSKPGQVLINIGRGPLVDEGALIQALNDGSLKGAALDVFDTEPLPPDHPFWKMENVFLSPHNMDQTATFLFDSVKFFVENANRYVKGHALRNLVDKKAGY